MQAHTTSYTSIPHGRSVVTAGLDVSRSTVSPCAYSTSNSHYNSIELGPAVALHDAEYPTPSDYEDQALDSDTSNFQSTELGVDGGWQDQDMHIDSPSAHLTDPMYRHDGPPKVLAPSQPFSIDTTASYGPEFMSSSHHLHLVQQAPEEFLVSQSTQAHHWPIHLSNYNEPVYSMHATSSPTYISYSGGLVEAGENNYLRDHVQDLNLDLKANGKGQLQARTVHANSLDGREVSIEDNSRTTKNCISYRKLLEDALRSAPDYQMPLQDIYNYVARHSDKAKDPNDEGWKNSVRHNLSMNGAFGAVGGKGSPWRLNAAAVRDGVVPTTRWRPRPEERRSKGRKTPAESRQRCGARGGKATRDANRDRKNAKRVTKRDQKLVNGQAAQGNISNMAASYGAANLDLSQALPTSQYFANQSINGMYANVTVAPLVTATAQVATSQSFTPSFNDIVALPDLNSPQEILNLGQLPVKYSMPGDHPTMTAPIVSPAMTTTPSPSIASSDLVAATMDFMPPTTFEDPDVAEFWSCSASHCMTSPFNSRYMTPTETPNLVAPSTEWKDGGFTGLELGPFFTTTSDDTTPQP